MLLWEYLAMHSGARFGKRRSTNGRVWVGWHTLCRYRPLHSSQQHRQQVVGPEQDNQPQARAGIYRPVALLPVVLLLSAHGCECASATAQQQHAAVGVLNPPRGPWPNQVESAFRSASQRSCMIGARSDQVPFFNLKSMIGQSL